MRIEFFTQDDPLYILPFFEEFVRYYGSEFEITQVSVCPVMGKRSRIRLLRELTCLYGIAGFLRILARVAAARVFGLLPRPRHARRFDTLAQLCRAYNLALRRIGNPNEAEFVTELRKRAPDVIVSVACPFILKEALLGVPPRGCVNIHHALLPRYKGMMPTFWQMFSGERNVGVTIHYMTARVDEGAALLQEELEIKMGESLDQLIQRSKRHGAHCMARVLRQIAVGTQQVSTLDQANATYFTFPTLEQMREFHLRGFRAV
jgi:methionyl-tRNA formyltransferase